MPVLSPRPTPPSVRPRRGLCALLLGLAMATPAIETPAAPLPERFTAIYALKKSGITIGETKRTLRREPGHYVFESVTRPKGIAKLFTNGQVVERSTWNFHQQKPRPETYSFFNSGSKKNRNVKLAFDWERNTVINTINGEPWSMPLEQGTQDKLLYQLRLMLDLPTDSPSLRYPIADGGKLKYYDIKIVGNERIRTELGTFDTVRLSRAKGGRKTTLWCARDLNYLPVRIEHREDDDSPVVAVLTSVKGLGARLATTKP